MGTSSMTSLPRGKRVFDQTGNSATLKSRKRIIIAVSVLISVFFVLRFDYPTAKQITIDVPGEFPATDTDISLGQTDNRVREAFAADPVSVPNAPITANTPVVNDAPIKNAEAKSAPASEWKKEATMNTETDPVDDGIFRGKPGTCLKHVLYDKPVKTGSTAISIAIRDFLALRGEKDKACAGKGPLSCVERAKSICNGTVEEKDEFSILGHLRFGGRELAECLRPKFYVVTSVREPYQRRKSAYLWNRTLNGTHFDIPHTASFKEFMNRMPRCQLHHYYDGRGWSCDTDMSLEDRIEDIVSRVDEVIDVYDDPAGPLHKLIAGFLRRENESIKLDEKDYVQDFDRDTLKEEQMLYDRLRAKRLEPPNMNRLLC